MSLPDTTFFVGLLDIQFLVGVAVCVVSPLRAIAFENPSSVLADDTGFAMFFHPVPMLIAIAVAHASICRGKA